MYLHLFGSATPTGEAFRQAVDASSSDMPLFVYSRRRTNNSVLNVDFLDPSSFYPGGELGASGLWISFGPIWLLASFLESLASSYPERLKGLCGVIACSSSSVISKRFAFNRFDQDLVARLTGSEEQLLTTCRRLQVHCRILQPTLIYGQVGSYCDSNLSRLLQLMRRLPCFPLPAHSGLRQPIHATQLAAVSLQLVHKLHNSRCDLLPTERIALGGDVTVTYADMVRALKLAQPPGDPSHRCRLLLIPNRLFFSLAFPLLFFSPKAFEAVLRMAANLSGFTPAHQLLGRDPLQFQKPQLKQ